MRHQILYFLQNLVIPPLLIANKERSSSERRMGDGIADETSMPPLKYECFGSAAWGQPPSVVGTHGLDRFLDERKTWIIGEVSTARPPATKSPFLLMTNQNTTSPAQAQPFITRTNLLTLALYMSHSGGSFGYRCIAVTAIHAVCVFV